MATTAKEASPAYTELINRSRAAKEKKEAVMPKKDDGSIRTTTMIKLRPEYMTALRLIKVKEQIARGANTTYGDIVGWALEAKYPKEIEEAKTLAENIE